jgi:alkylation response protein AidB-like acyl-CoA dehydrogenase
MEREPLSTREELRMNVELTEEQTLLQSTSRQFLDQALSLDALRHRSENDLALSRDFWSRAAALGWTSMFVPDDLNDPQSDAPVRDLAIIAEEAGRSLESGSLLECNVVAYALVNTGTTEVKAQLLPGLSDGSITASWAFAEGVDGWSVSDVRSRATVDGDDYVLNAQKSTVVAATSADYFLVTAFVDDELAQFLVPRDAPGVAITRLDALDLSRDFGDVSFHDVRVKKAWRLGSPGESADNDVERQWLLTITLQCAQMAGMLDRVFNLTIDYAQDRYAFGRPIASYQALKHRLADHKVWLEAALGLSTGLTEAFASGDPGVAELACVAKAHVGDRSVEIISDCAQIFGGISMTWEHDLHLYLRRATVDRVLYGSPTQLRERLCQLVGL